MILWDVKSVKKNIDLRSVHVWRVLRYSLVPVRGKMASTTVLLGPDCCLARVRWKRAWTIALPDPDLFCECLEAAEAVEVYWRRWRRPVRLDLVWPPLLVHHCVVAERGFVLEDRCFLHIGYSRRNHPAQTNGCTTRRRVERIVNKCSQLRRNGTGTNAANQQEGWH